MHASAAMGVGLTLGPGGVRQGASSAPSPLVGGRRVLRVARRIECKAADDASGAASNRKLQQNVKVSCCPRVFVKKSNPMHP